MLTLKELTSRFPQNGKLEWIGTRPGRRFAVESHQQMAVLDRGLEADRSVRANNRSVTLIQAEHLPVIAALCAKELVDPAELRRNLVVSGINLLALKGRQFSLGDVILEGMDICAPCSHMEKILGTGGYNAMRGHGGITAKVIKTGIISIGDNITAL